MIRPSGNLFIVGVNATELDIRALLRKGAVERVRYMDGSDTIRFIRGLYLRSGLSKGARKKVLRDNALRIASFIHRKAGPILLSGPTALNQAEVNGSILLSSINAYGSKHIEGGFVIHYQRLDDALSSDGPLMRSSIRRNWIEDDLGRFEINSLPDELVLLYSFASAMRQAADVSDEENKKGVVRDRNLLSIIDQKRLIERMKAEKGDIKDVRRSLERMASRFPRMGQALDRALEFLEANYLYSAFSSPNVELNVRYGPIRIGEITEGNKLWRFENKASLPIFEFVRNPSMTTSGDIPVFFEALLPERFRPVDGRERSGLYRMFMDGQRCLNSISIHNVHAPKPVIIDRIEKGGALSRHVDAQQVFSGRVELEARETPDRRVQIDLLTRLCEVPYEPGHPFIPGMQEKAACHLGADGVLRFATDRPFTHIIKFPGSEAYATKGANEWACMQLLEAAGVKVCANALVDIPGAGIAYLTERFDIPNAEVDKAARVYCFEDFCSLMNVGIHQKYRHIDLAQMARLIYTESSASLEDLEQFFRQVCGSIMVGNFDGHARNFGLLSSLPASRIEVGAHGPVESLGSLEGLKIRLAPAFDVLSTVIYPFSTDVPLAMAGHRSYSHRAALDFGRHCGIGNERVDRILSEMGHAMHARVCEILSGPPEIIAGRPDIMNAIDLIRCRIERTCHDFGVVLEAAPMPVEEDSFCSDEDIPVPYAAPSMMRRP